MSRRTLEAGKSILIVVLVLIAALLILKTPIYKEMTGEDLTQSLHRLTVPAVTRSTLTSDQSSPVPSVIVIGTGHARYAVRYDDRAVGRVYDELHPLLGDVLRAAEAPRTVSESEWLTALSGSNIYLLYPGRVPLDALSDWLGSDGAPPASLPGSVRCLLLCPDADGALLLYYPDESTGEYCVCRTSPALTGRLETLYPNYPENGALFAYETDLPLAPATVLLPEPPACPVLTAASVDLTDDTLSDLLTALSFNPRTKATYSTEEGRVVVEGASVLRIAESGLVTYDSGQEDRLSFPGNASDADRIGYARQLAARTVGAHCGDATLYLMDAVTDDKGGYVIRFGYCLDGLPILPEGADCAACFRLTEDRVDTCTLCYRSYTRTDTLFRLLPEAQAAAAMQVLGEDGAPLAPGYAGSGPSLEPSWLVL